MTADIESIQAPTAESFTHGGRSYVLNPTTTSGEVVDQINAAVQRSKVKKAQAALVVAKSLPEGDDELKQAKQSVIAGIMGELTNTQPINILQLRSYVQNDPDVIAAVVWMTCSDVATLGEAEVIVDNYPELLTLGTKCLIASGLHSLGKSVELQTTLERAQALSLGEGQSGGEQSAASVESGY